MQQVSFLEMSKKENGRVLFCEMKTDSIHRHQHHRIVCAAAVRLFQKQNIV